MICMISQKHSIKLFSAVRNNYLFQSRPLKWILAAYFRQLYCVSLNFGILNLFPFLDLHMKGLYDTGAEKMSFTWYYIHTRPIVGVVGRYCCKFLRFLFPRCWTREQKTGTFMFIIEQPELIFQLSSPFIYHCIKHGN